MKFSEISSLLRGVPFISELNAHFLYDLIANNDVENILELGIAHGTATCYMAAALQQRGRGRIDAVDLKGADYRPSAEEQVSRHGFGGLVTIHREQTGYNWFLRKAIRDNTVNDQCQPVYDLCIIDGPKNWTIDSSAFFLADKLLKPGGWLIFDDYSWTYGLADMQRDVTDGITHRLLSEEEMRTPHIREVFELLVKQHPDYGHLIVKEDSDWAIARKVASPQKSYSVVYDESALGIFGKLARKAYHRLKRRDSGRPSKLAS
ncbi:hypothetical protein BB934_12400 [Microvirga ossetica]|uniref:Methyltransferase n=1 Tax=Microvirga ossetica TaxID=1882682 RepID=A0A1B2EG09_9HYPH|nr:class I SAM-dependent methyltransferase [Microvirga ossetica]ANY78913.1 hypothetical protein BB934_12400 [Microvirga ossetica]